jgi:hypothetical protein
MGGKGSGNNARARLVRSYEQAAAKDQSAATKLFYSQLRQQMGDKLFQVWRVYPSGKKAEVGTTENITTDQLAKMFGGGEYELHEINRTDNMPTGKPPLRKTLHPGKYPIKAEFSKDPIDIELEAAAAASAEKRATSDAAQLRDLGLGADMTPAQIYERARAAAKQEMERELEARELRTLVQQLGQKVTELQTAIATGGTAPGGSTMQQLTQLGEFMKQFMPPPVTNPINVPTSPLQQLKEALEAMKLLQGEMQTIKSGSAGAIIGNAIKGGIEGVNPNLALLTNTLVDLAKTAAPYFSKVPAGVGAPAPLPMQSGQPAAPAAAPAPVAGAAPANSALARRATDEETKAMMGELLEKLQRDQAAQLQQPPQGHISETVNFVRSRWNDPGNIAWQGLKRAVLGYPDHTVIDFLKENSPTLCASAPALAWCQTLVELLKKP